MQNPLALYRSDQVHRQKRQSHTELEALATDILEDQQQERFMAQKERGGVRPDKQQSLPSVEHFFTHPNRMISNTGREEELEVVVLQNCTRMTQDTSSTRTLHQRVIATDWP